MDNFNKFKISKSLYNQINESLYFYAPLKLKKS